MSWYLTIGPVEASMFAATVEAAQLSETAPSAETEEQVRVAKRAALTLFFSGAVGDYTKGRFQAALYGHSNPGHVRPSDYAQDTVTVTVSQEFVERPADSGATQATYAVPATA